MAPWLNWNRRRKRKKRGVVWEGKRVGNPERSRWMTLHINTLSVRQSSGTMHAARASAPSALALNPAPAQATSIQPDHSSSSSTECTRAGAPHCCHWSMTSAGNYFPYQWRQSSRPGARCMSVLYSTVLFVAKQGRAHRWTSEREKTEKGKGRECLCVSTAAAIQSSNSAALQKEKLFFSFHSETGYIVRK